MKIDATNFMVRPFEPTALDLIMGYDYYLILPTDTDPTPNYAE